MTLYAFLYNDCVHESSWATMSLHATPEAAQVALEEHKAKKKEEWFKLYLPTGEPDTEEKYEEPYPFGDMSDWCVTPMFISGLEDPTKLKQEIDDLKKKNVNLAGLIRRYKSRIGVAFADLSDFWRAKDDVDKTLEENAM